MHVSVLYALINDIQLIEGSFTIFLFNKVSQWIKVFCLFGGLHVPVPVLNFIFSISNMGELLLSSLILVSDFPISLY
jgi:hypothetical protein